MNSKELKRLIESTVKRILMEDSPKQIDGSFISYYNGSYFVDRHDDEEIKDIVKPGDIIQFKYMNKIFTAKVSYQAVGRDDDYYKLYVINKK